MEIGGILGMGSMNISAPSYRRRGAASYQDQRAETKKQDYQRKQALLALHTRAADLSKELVAFRDSVQAVRDIRRTRTFAATASDGSLGLDLSPRATTLVGTDQVNPAPKSYSTRGPTWDGPDTTSEATLHGDYTGTLTDTLEFRVHRDRTVGGLQQVRLNVYDSTGKYLERVNFNAGTPPDTIRYTSFGIGVSLGAGDVARNESFFIDVDAGTGQDLDPTQAFDGIRADDPWLETGVSVTAGSFEINGELITVAADDSVDSVLAAINASAAGVTAVYDPATDTVELERDEVGALDISFANDTSGFVAAMKLDGAVQDTGNEHGEIEEAIQDVPVLSGIGTGTFSINGTDVSVDVTSDSLQDVVDRINATVANVTAGFDANSNRFTITGNTPSDPLSLDDGTSNFFSGVDVSATEYTGREGARGVRRKARQVALDLEAIEDKLNAVFDTVDNESLASKDLKQARKLLQAGIEGLFEDTDDLGTDFGIDFDFGNGDVLDFSLDDAQDLREDLRRSNSDAVDFLIGERDEDGEGGMIGAMLTALSQMGSDLGDIHGYTGLLLDIKV